MKQIYLQILFTMQRYELFPNPAILFPDFLWIFLVLLIYINYKVLLIIQLRYK